MLGTRFARMFALSVWVGLTWTAAFAQSDEAGQAGGPLTPKACPATPVPTGWNDLLQSDEAFPLASPRAARPALDEVYSPPAPRVALSERLRAWDDSTRANAQLAVELPGHASNEVCAAARAVETAWNSGHYEPALTLLAWLEASGTPVAAGVAWKSPRPLDSTDRFSDTRIGTRTGGSLVELDYDAASDKLFAVVNWVTDGWALYQSTNDGGTWSETYLWPAAVADVDLAVVAGYVYVGYIYTAATDEARLRRNFVGDGSPDTAYGLHVVMDVSPNTLAEVAVESNADSFDNRIYYALRQSNAAIRYAWDVASDGTTFVEDSPAGTSASNGLDLHWNPGAASWFLFLSYVGTDDQVHVLRHSETDWENIVVDATFTGGYERTAISAYDETVICAYEESMTNGLGIRYWISYDAGDTWNWGDIAAPGASQGSYYLADITARGGRGTAAVCTQEVGEPDHVFLRLRRGYAPGGWRAAIRVNDYDVQTGTWTAINWTAPETTIAGELSYGLVYFYGAEHIPYFNRFHLLLGDLNCDGVIDFGDINPFVLALSDPAGYEAMFPNCELLNGDCDEDGTVDFDDISPFVDILSGGD